MLNLKFKYFDKFENVINYVGESKGFLFISGDKQLQEFFEFDIKFEEKAAKKRNFFGIWPHDLPEEGKIGRYNNIHILTNPEYCTINLREGFYLFSIPYNEVYSRIINILMNEFGFSENGGTLQLKGFRIKSLNKVLDSLDYRTICLGFKAFNLFKSSYEYQSIKPFINMNNLIYEGRIGTIGNKILLTDSFLEPWNRIDINDFIATNKVYNNVNELIKELRGRKNGHKNL